jgi:hypothetical protein
MIKVSKYKALQILGSIDDVVFVGGTSEYLQGIKKELNDIDISVRDENVLNEIGFIHKSNDQSFYGLSGKRGFIPLESVLIDIFIDEKKPDFITFNGFKCETAESMMRLQKETLKLNSENLSDKTKMKLRNNIERLKIWQA